MTTPSMPALPAVLFGNGLRTCIAYKRGRKYFHAVEMGEPIRITRVSIGDSPARWPMQLRGKPYPVRKAARQYLRSEISKTGRAAKVLRAIARGRVPA